MPTHFPNIDLKKALDQAKALEQLTTRFKAVTGIGVDDVLSFYCATGDFPTFEQIQFIKVHGIKAVHEAIYKRNTEF